MTVILCLAVLPASALADYKPVDSVPHKRELTLEERKDLARQFVSKISQGLEKADIYLGKTVAQSNIEGLPEGEDLPLRIRIRDKINTQKPYLTLDDLVLSFVKSKKVLVSFRDFVGALEFPIQYNVKTGIASGWYIRENRPFTIDGKARQVTNTGKSYQFSPAVEVKDDDIFVPVAELAQWFDFKLNANAGDLSLNLESDRPLPVQEAYQRRNRIKSAQDNGPPVLPTQKDGGNLIDYPFVDVSTDSSYRRSGDGEKPEIDQSASIRTSGDFAKGTLITQTQLDREDKLRSIRANYKRESLQPELLGPLKARRFELGDVDPVISPLQQNSSQSFGTRITNADPLRDYLRPSTDVTGTYFPNWDVELYRDNQLLDFQTIGDDGQYRFENVDLYSSANNFRLVFYGPQGEIKEEPFNVPVDIERLSDMGSSYDISIGAQELHSYDKLANDDDDKGTPLLTAFYEQPVGEVSAVTLGFEAGQLNSKQHETLHSGFATTFGGTLFNFDAAMDSESEVAGQMVARRDFGSHQFRNELTLYSDNYASNSSNTGNSFGNGLGETNTASSSSQEVLRDQFNINGPLGINIGKYTRYNLGLTYSETSDGENQVSTSAGFNTLWDRISFGQTFTNAISSNSEEGDELYSQTTVTGGFGINRLRFSADYQIKPQSQLESLMADIRRPISKDLDLDFNLEHDLDPALTTGTAKIDWDAGFANISPSLSYNSDRDVIALLNTRFGLIRDPGPKDYQSYERAQTSTGAVSAFVYLDKNGDNIFNDQDEPLPDVAVYAPQNGGHETTDETGYALLRNLSRMRLTDVYVDENTLADPLWLSGFKGASILPREGYVARLEFPIHAGGEMDGTLYARSSDGTVRPLRSIKIALYDMSGKKAISASTESDGFFVLSKIPPGDYFLNVDGDTAAENYARPLPQKIHIGFEGTTKYANNIYLEEGRPDVPIAILSDNDIAKDNVEKFEGNAFNLNLGTYKSQLMMSLMWFKIRNVYASIVNDTSLLDPPSKSLPDIKTGLYSLRLGVKNANLDIAYRKCQIFIQHGQSCSIEILPGALAGEDYKPIKQADAGL